MKEQHTHSVHLLTIRNFIPLYFSLVLLISAGRSLAQSDEFVPAEDGWYFKNFSTLSKSLTWDLYRKTYLAINPKHDCLEAPLDCAFYEIFQISSKNGNCGGMSLLGLALFKYGGYMGFCSPAKFYTGDLALTPNVDAKGPDDQDLYKAINIMQARQFSAAGISYILDLGKAGNLNNADVAFKHVKEALGRGDYPLLCIANDTIGESAHTLIAYKVQDGPSGGYPKIIYLWDSNHPFNNPNDPSHYAGSSTANHLVITNSYDWTYTSGGTSYKGSSVGNAWCFCVPMSVILEKSRQPIALDFTIKVVKTLVISGMGSTASQISDDEGHRFYKTDADVHIDGSDLERDPDKRLKEIIRWRWFDQVNVNRFDSIGTSPSEEISEPEQELPELYFLRGPIGKVSALNVIISGTSYKVVFASEGNLIQINCESFSQARDVIRLSRVATSAQSLEIRTMGEQRNFTVQQLRSDITGREWRSFGIKNLNISRDVPVEINVVGDLDEILVSSLDKTVDFDLDIQQRLEGKVSIKNAGRLFTTPGQLLRVAPKDWRMLEETELKKDLRQQMEIRK